MDVSIKLLFVLCQKFIIALFRISYLVKGVRRGCASDLSSDDFEKCLSNGDYCKLCDGINCNKKIKPQLCIRCNSEVDLNCINTPTRAPSLECDHYDDKCITIIHSNETILRDCQRNAAIDETFCDKNPWLCNTCETDNCNKITVIDKHCHECDSKANPDCATKPDDSMLVNCPFSATNPGCYHFINETGN